MSAVGTVFGGVAGLYGGGVSGILRLADLLGGLSMVADSGFGLPPGTAVRTGLVAAALGRRMGLADGEVRDGLYTGLLMHVGCVGISHESAAVFGDDIRFYRAVTGTDVNDPDDVATVLDEVTRGMPADAAARTTSFLRTRGFEWARRADTGV